MSFQQALTFTLKEEGGYVNNQNDRGGATNKGITQHSYDAWRTAKGISLQSVEMLTDAECEQIYQEDYWQPAHCDALSVALAIVHFDTCVNMGVNAGIKMLQRAAGVTYDGIFGEQTKVAIQSQADTMVSSYLQQRINRYNAIVEANPSQDVFLKGWLNRVEQLRQYVESL